MSEIERSLAAISFGRIFTNLSKPIGHHNLFGISKKNHRVTTHKCMESKLYTAINHCIYEINPD